ncbi:gamma-glutamyltransferase family protein [Actinoplanes sp. NPDC051343]|uniref:gamma-glutamyltransferase family protein n=1 Tax=Actinoplanes sp. NPDC051343 TaxID=3363906 RepID=UPI0037A66DA7
MIDVPGFRDAPGRGPAVAAEAMVATSQAPATLAGLDMLRRGGSAADAAIAAAAVCCVAEPMSTGIGGDAFAIVWDGGAATGLDAAGPAPRNAQPHEVPAAGGPRSVDVPGAVAGWAALSERYGKLGLDTCLAPAIDLAERGVAAGYHCSWMWRHTAHAPAEFGPAPETGQVFRLPDLGRTLRLIAGGGPQAFYRGPVAAAMAASTWLTEDDLAAYSAGWVEPLRYAYRGVDVLEMPPPTQGVAALEALGLLSAVERPALGDRMRAVALALEDAYAQVRDGADVSGLLTPSHLSARGQDRPRLLREPAGGTVYLCALDGDGMAVSFIQSLYESFGSGVVAPGTGVVLNNRAEGFGVSGSVEPGRRPYHTLMPGMLVENGRLRGPFGVMGGFIQAQAHVQYLASVLDDGLDPQAALDRARFRIDAGRVRLEEGLASSAASLEAAGWPVHVEPDRMLFGGGQAIDIRAGRILGGSDPRKDGFAAGF